MFELKPFQKQALSALQSGRRAHVLCLAPTGSGKSAIFERYLIESGSKAILIVPLVALAAQHAQRLNELGVRDKVWIASPESLAKRESELQRFGAELWILDECHCIWEWGESFRPHYARVFEWLERFRPKRTLWLTATLTQKMRAELRQKLFGPLVEVGRSGLPSGLTVRLERQPLCSRLERLLALINTQSGSGIVFVITRESSERLTRAIRAAGRRAWAFHAGLSREERQTIQTQLSRSEDMVVVATSAFGMGIHLETTRWVILWQAPLSYLSLVQQIGRVGRGGKRGEAVILWDDSDFKSLEWSAKSNPEKWNELNEVRRFLMSGSVKNRLHPNLL